MQAVPDHPPLPRMVVSQAMPSIEPLERFRITRIREWEGPQFVK
jgi:hypothetical protein